MVYTETFWKDSVTQKIMPTVDKWDFMNLKVSAQQRKRCAEIVYRMRKKIRYTSD